MRRGSFDDVVKNFTDTLSGIRDYKAQLHLTQKYFRLKSMGKITASVIKDPVFFLFEFDDDFRINHLHLTSPGGKTCYYRDKSTYATIGGGAMKLAGIEEMHIKDRRADFAFGERLISMNLFALKDRMKWYAKNGSVSVEMAKVNNQDCPRLIMKKKTPPRPVEIQDMAIIFNPDTWLPIKIEYLNTADKDGFAVIEYKSIKTNQGLNEENLKF